MKAIDIKTEIGIEILQSLVRANGWHIQQQYDESAFDKGVDFDRYVIEKNGLELCFEWTNWLEWEITGDSNILERLSSQYGLKLEDI